MADKSKNLSIVDKGFKVEGTIHANGRLIIRGELEGTLIGDTVVTVDGSRVHGEAKVQQMVVAGEFEGDITALHSLKILPTGIVWGKVVCRSLTLETGGKLNGSVRPLESKDKALETYTESATAKVNPSSRHTEGEEGDSTPP